MSDNVTFTRRDAQRIADAVRLVERSQRGVGEDTLRERSPSPIVQLVTLNSLTPDGDDRYDGNWILADGDTYTAEDAVWVMNPNGVSLALSTYYLARGGPFVNGRFVFFICEPEPATASNHLLLNGSTHTDTVAQAAAKGALVVGNATPKWDRLTVGTDAYVLTADSAQTLGVKWAPASGSGTLTSITATTPIVVTPDPITTTGTISHAASGVTPTTYGDSSHYPIFTVNATGHLTAASIQAVYYQTFEYNTNPLTQRAVVNFIDGGAHDTTIVGADNAGAGRTEYTVEAYSTIQDGADTVSTQRDRLKLTGSQRPTITDDSGNGRTIASFDIPLSSQNSNFSADTAIGTYYLVTISGGDVICTLPDASNGKLIHRFKIDGAANGHKLVINRETTDVIDGVTSYTMDKDYQYIELYRSASGNWWVDCCEDEGGVNTQTGTTYTFARTDRGLLITFTNASPIAATLPQATTNGFGTGFVMDVQNRGVGTLTITPTTSTIDGAASIVIRQDHGLRIFSNGTDYYTQRGILKVPVLVSEGGTGLTTFNTYSVVATGTTATGPFTDLGSSTSAYIMIGQGSAAYPTWNAVSGDVTMDNAGVMTVGAIIGRLTTTTLTGDFSNTGTTTVPQAVGLGFTASGNSTKWRARWVLYVDAPGTFAGCNFTVTYGAGTPTDTIWISRGTGTTVNTIKDDYISGAGPTTNFCAGNNADGVITIDLWVNNSGTAAGTILLKAASVTSPQVTTIKKGSYVTSWRET